MPWAFYAITGTAYSMAGAPSPDWLDRFFPLFVLCFPIAVFIAIYRYHLFDMALVVGRSFLYTALTTTLVLAYLAAIGLGSLLFRAWCATRFFRWCSARPSCSASA